MHRAHEHAYPLSVFCHVLISAKSEICNETCLIDLLVIVFSDPLWLMVSKSLLSSALNRLMPCHNLLCSDPVACYYLALNMPS